MYNLIDEKTRIITQGITTHYGKFHSELGLKFGSNIVAGVGSCKGEKSILGLNIYDSVKVAKEATGCNATQIFVPAAQAKSAILEAINADIELIVCLTEKIPIKDILFVMEALKEKPHTRFIGPNTFGIVRVGFARLGIMPIQIFKKGRIGIVSRSKTLTYEAIFQTSKEHLGQSTCIGIGSDSIVGFSFIDALKFFEKDNDTKAILLLGEIGGMQEELAADWIKTHASKPCFAYIAGQTAPIGKRMGHQGAIIYSDKESAKDKIITLKAAGVKLIMNGADIGLEIKKGLQCNE